MHTQMPAWRRTATRMSRRSCGRHSQIAAVAIVGNEGTGAIGMRAIGIEGRIALRFTRADVGAVAVGDRGGAAVPPPAATHAAGVGASQAPRQRVSDECRKRLMSMLS